MIERNPYLNLIHGERVADSAIREKAGYTRPALDILFRDGALIGQGTLEGDIIWWIPAKVKEAELNGKTQKQEEKEEKVDYGRYYSPYRTF